MTEASNPKRLWAAAVLAAIACGPTPRASAATVEGGAPGRGNPIPIVTPRIGTPALSGESQLNSLMQASGIPGLPAGLPADSALPAGQGKLPSAPAQMAPNDPKEGLPRVAPGEKPLDQVSEELKPRIEAASDPSSADPRGTGERIQEIIQGQPKTSSTGDEVPAPEAGEPRSGLGKAGPGELPRESGVPAPYGFVRERLSNPGDLYARAYKEAVEVAQAQGYRPEQVHFAEVAASLPVRDGQHLKFTYYVTETPDSKTGRPVYVDFSRGYGTIAGRFESRRWAHSGEVSIPRPLFPKLDHPYYFDRGSLTSPDTALTLAQEDIEGLGSRVSFSLRYQQEEETGDTDLWYRFYDDDGSEAAVNARTGEVRGEPAPPAEPSWLERAGRFIADVGGVLLGVVVVAGFALAALGVMAVKLVVVLAVLAALGILGLLARLLGAIFGR